MKIKLCTPSLKFGYRTMNRDMAKLQCVISSKAFSMHTGDDENVAADDVGIIRPTDLQ